MKYECGPPAMPSMGLPEVSCLNIYRNAEDVMVISELREDVTSQTTDSGARTLYALQCQDVGKAARSAGHCCSEILQSCPNQEQLLRGLPSLLTIPGLRRSGGGVHSHE